MLYKHVIIILKRCVFSITSGNLEPGTAGKS